MVNHKKTCVYFIEGIGTGLVKIGTSVDPKRRLKMLQIGSPSKLFLFGSIPSNVVSERQWHKLYKDYRHHGEWFKMEGALELFIHKAFR